MRRRRFLRALLGVFTVPLFGWSGRLRPQQADSTTAEHALMGALLLEPRQLGEVAQLLEAWMFRDQQSGTAYRWMVQQARAGRPHDLDAIVAARLPGDPTAYGTWIDSTPRWDGARDYAQVVRDRRPGFRAAWERRRRS